MNDDRYGVPKGEPSIVGIVVILSIIAGILIYLFKT